MIETNKIFLGDCRDIMRNIIPENSVDLIVTSPPYNVGINYPSWDDNQPWKEYLKFAKEWLEGAYRCLKPDGRIVLNIPWEISKTEFNPRKFMVKEYANLMDQIGFQYHGSVDLEEIMPERVKLTAWGSWLSPSAPYVYNPKEILILACKDHWKKDTQGVSYFNESNKAEFQRLVYACWKYTPEMNGLTQANFSLDIPMNALKLFTWENDIVLDPFMGSGTTAEACIRLNRRYIGCEISKENYEKMKCRTNQTRIS